MACRILSIAGLDASSARWQRSRPRWLSIRADPLPRYPFSGSRPAANPCTEVRSVCSSIPSGGSGTPTAAHSSCPIASGCRSWRRLPALAAPVRRSLACPPARCRRFAPVRSTSRSASITSRVQRGPSAASAAAARDGRVPWAPNFATSRRRRDFTCAPSFARLGRRVPRSAHRTTSASDQVNLLIQLLRKYFSSYFAYCTRGSSLLKHRAQSQEGTRRRFSLHHRDGCFSRPAHW